MHSKPSIGAGLAALILILSAVACGPSGELADTPLSPSATPATDTAQPALEQGVPATTPLPGPTAADLGPEAEQVMVLTQEDLARRLSIAPEAIAARSIEAVTWPDAGLGCPQPGMAYAQVLTPGFRVILETAGQAYEYHTGTPQPIVLCEKEDALMEASGPTGTVEPAGTVEPGMETLVDQAREDLAQRLSVPVGQIAVLEAKAVVWPDASLGCPVPGMEYIQVPQDGFLIRLSVAGTVYEYHGGGGREMFLCGQPLELEKESPPQLELPRPTPEDTNP